MYIQRRRDSYESFTTSNEFTGIEYNGLHQHFNMKEIKRLNNDGHEVRSFSTLF
jgi:hypothetical protein